MLFGLLKAVGEAVAHLGTLLDNHTLSVCLPALILVVIVPSTRHGQRLPIRVNKDLSNVSSKVFTPREV